MDPVVNKHPRKYHRSKINCNSQNANEKVVESKYSYQNFVISFQPHIPKQNSSGAHLTGILVHSGHSLQPGGPYIVT